MRLYTIGTPTASSNKPNSTRACLALASPSSGDDERGSAPDDCSERMA
jgi:hypothetical protein